MVLVQRGDIVFLFLPFFRDSPHARVHYRESNNRCYNLHSALSSYSSSRYPSRHRIEAMTRPLPAACPANRTRRVSPRLPVHWVLTNNCAADRSDHPWQHTPDNEIATFFICDSDVLQGHFPHSAAAVATPPQSCTSRIAILHPASCILHPECAARATSPSQP